MSKQENPRLQARLPRKMKEVFDRFIEEENMQQAEFFEEYLPSLLMAINKERYLRIYQDIYMNVSIENEIKNRGEKD